MATHPVCEGRIVSGLQDNGIIERSSSSTWRHTGVGDGGGVIFDPTDPDRYLRQYHNALWDSSDGAQFGNLLRRDSTLGDRDKEIDKSAFYSRPAAISVSDPLRDSQVAIGTTRVWYTQDWGLTYVTLPSASDPITKTRYNLGRDDFGDPITVCRWAEPDILSVVGFNHVARMVRTPGTDNLFHPGDWTRDPLLERDAKDKKDSSTSDAPIRDTVVFTDLAPNPNDTADGTGSFRRGAKGAAYLGAVAGDGASTDTLYWFDGDETWHATGLRAVVPAPVTAVVTDPADADAVYVGTTRRRVRRLPNDCRPADMDVASLGERLARGGGRGSRAVRPRRRQAAACGSRIARHLGDPSRLPTSRISPTCGFTTTTSDTDPRHCWRAETVSPSGPGTAVPTCDHGWRLR